MPIYIRLWEDAGQGPTKDFVDRSFRYYVLLGMPIIAGLSAVGPELLTILASEKYRAGAQVIPGVVGGLVSAGAIPIAAAGVFIHKRTWLVARYVLLCASLNLVLNVVLLPTIGIQGAAIATLVSYLLLLVLMTRAGIRLLPVRIPWGVIVRAAAVALSMYTIVAPIHVGARVGTVAARTAIGLVVYALLILAIDKTAREGLAALMARVKELTQ
jgi:O-antigen/teichoic acid export membrane protein